MKIAIIGTGTGGILSLCHCLTHLDSNSWQVYSINDPNKPILGIGESTSTQIPCALHDAVGFTLLENANELDATLKLAVKFSKWRDRDFYNHMNLPSYAIHFDNQSLKGFTFKRFEELYENFHTIHGNVDRIESREDEALVSINGDDYKFDYVIDCGGYPEDYSDYTFSKCISVNNCLTYNIKEPGNFNYTEHKATPNGWLFGIPLQSRQGWGYLYNDTITKKEDAIKDFKENYFPDIDVSNIREFKFKSYVANTIFDGRILKNGNRALFYEPIEAFSGYFYEQVLRYFFDYLRGVYNIEKTNDTMLEKANEIELAIAYIYHGGSIYNTPFWEHAKKISKIKLNRDREWKWHCRSIREMKKEDPKGLKARYDGVGAFSIKNWIDLERNLGYDLF